MFCVGCPFSKHINEELAVIEKYEPNLYKAAMHLFGKSYEYTSKYRAFVKEMKAKEKERKQHDRLSGNAEISSGNSADHGDSCNYGISVGTEEKE